MYTNAAPKTSARQQTPTSAGKAQLRRFGDYFNFRQLQTGASDKPRRCLSALAVARGIPPLLTPTIIGLPTSRQCAVCTGWLRLT